MSLWSNNLKALAQRPESCFKQLFQALKTLSAVEEGEFPLSKEGQPLPWMEEGGRKMPVASLYDQKKEALRWISELQEPWGAVWVWGLASLDMWQVLIKHSGCFFAAEPRTVLWHRSFSCADWQQIIGCRRWHGILAQKDSVEKAINQNYDPLLDGAFQSRMWRPLPNNEIFKPLISTLEVSLAKKSADVSTQAQLARRWYRNTLINMKKIADVRLECKNLCTAAVAGAGPGLEEALESPQGRALIKGRPDNGFFLLTTDTALGVLQARRIRPDVILTLDSQLASYHHFVPSLDQSIPIVADLACLPMISSLPNPVLFFLSAHPLHQMLRQFFPTLLTLDTSLGHVVGLGLRLAERLGAQRTLLWGADYSYPLGKAYARDTYLTPYFLQRSCRLAPFESLQAAFVFRTSQLIRQKTAYGMLYTNELLLAYKKALEQQSSDFKLSLEVFHGKGLNLHLSQSQPQKITCKSFIHQSSGRKQAQHFLTFWSKEVGS